MKISKEDIQKYGTEDEKKALTERRVEVKRRKSGRRTNQNKFEEYKQWLKIDIENIETNFAWESWDELETELDGALQDVRKLMMYAPKED